MKHPFSSDRTRRLAAAAALALSALAVAAAQPASRRLVAVADIHGDLAAFTGILRQAAVVDGAGAWSGGRTVLAQTGDYLDRGADIRQVVDLLRALEKQAASAGGRVHVLLGNHEAMNLLVEYRDVNPVVYAAFADAGSEARRERAFADYIKLGDQREKALGQRPPVYDQRAREAWMAAHPPGLLEYNAAFGPDGEYGRWVRERQVIVEVDGTLLMHAGIDPVTAPASIEDVNRLVADAIRSYDAARRHMVERGLILPFFTLTETIAAAVAEADALKAGRSPNANARHVEMLNVILGIGQSPLIAAAGPLWYRGYSEMPEDTGAPQFEALLQRYKARRLVAGHSVQRKGDIVVRFDRRLFLIDTGMLASVYKGNASALEIEGDRVTAIYPDRRVVLSPPGDQRPAAAR